MAICVAWTGGSAEATGVAAVVMQTVEVTSEILIPLRDIYLGLSTMLYIKYHGNPWINKATGKRQTECDRNYTIHPQTSSIIFYNLQAIPK